MPIRIIICKERCSLQMIILLSILNSFLSPTMAFVDSLPIKYARIFSLYEFKIRRSQYESVSIYISSSLNLSVLLLVTCNKRFAVGIISRLQRLSLVMSLQLETVLQITVYKKLYVGLDVIRRNSFDIAGVRKHFGTFEGQNMLALASNAFLLPNCFPWNRITR